MYTQFHRFIATVLLFSILLQSCGNPSLRIIEPARAGGEPGEPQQTTAMVGGRQSASQTLGEHPLSTHTPSSHGAEPVATSPTAAVPSTAPSITPATIASGVVLPPSTPDDQGVVTSPSKELESATEPLHSFRSSRPLKSQIAEESISPVADTHVVRDSALMPLCARRQDAPLVAHPSAASESPVREAMIRVDDEIALPAFSSSAALSPISGQHYLISQGRQVSFQQEESGVWQARVVDVWGGTQVLPVVCAPDQTQAQAIAALSGKILIQHKHGIHILETSQPPWAPRVVYVGALGLRGGGQVGSVATKLARGVYGWVSLPFNAIAYAFKDSIPPLPCRVGVLSKHDKEDLPDSKVKNSCKVGGKRVTFYKSDGYWWARTSRFKYNNTIVGDLCYDYKSDSMDIPVKCRRSASLSLEDLVNCQFSIRKYRKKSFHGFMTYNFLDYNDYLGLGYELELLTPPEEIQNNKEARRRSRREKKRQEEERKREEKRKKQEAAQEREAAVLQRAREEQRQADLRRAEEEQQKEAQREAQKRKEEERARKEKEQDARLESMAEKWAKRFAQGPSSTWTHEHRVINEGYLSDDELDHGVGANTGSGIDFGEEETQESPSDTAAKEKTSTPPLSPEVFAEQLQRREACAQSCGEHEQEKQKDTMLLLRETRSCLNGWKAMAAADTLGSSAQHHVAELHEKLLVLPDRLANWQRRLQDWSKSLEDWASDLQDATSSVLGVDDQSSTCQNRRRDYQEAKATFDRTQNEYQALFQDVLTALSAPDYYAALTTPQLQRQSISLAHKLLHIANETATKKAHDLQHAEQAYQSMPSRVDRAKNQLAIARKRWVRKQVEVMAHALNHQPLLDYLSGKGQGYINRVDAQGKTSLHSAVDQGQVEVVKWLLDHRADVAAKDADGRTPLDWAVRKNDTNSIKILVAHNANVKGKNAAGYTPLHYATQENCVDAVTTLLDHGANIEAQGEDGFTPLHYAAEAGNEAMIRLLLRRGAGINAKDEWGHTPLHRAALKGHINAAESLLEGKVTIDAKDIDNNTPLHFAVQGKHVDIVELLLIHGAHRKAKNKDGLTPLYYAVQMGNVPVTKALLYHIADIKSQNIGSSTLLHCAAQQGSKAIVQLLLSCGADIDTKDEEGCTSLHRAVQQGHTAVVEWLLTKGADISARDRSGFTPLHWAVQQNYPIITELLLVRGADQTLRDTKGRTPKILAASLGHQLEDPARKVVHKKVEALAHATHHWPLLYYLAGKGAQYINEKDARGKTALHCAMLQDDPCIVTWLLDHGANVAIKDTKGFTPLHTAAEQGHNSSASILLDCGANIEARDEDGDTPLHYAAFEKHTTTAQLLLDRGACIEAQDRLGITPLSTSALLGDVSTLTLLLNRGATIDTKDSTGFAPLHLAASKGNITISQLLLDHGANIEAEDLQGHTPLHCAVDKGQTRTVELLLKRGARINIRNQVGTTPLYLAAHEGNKDIISLLLDHELRRRMMQLLPSDYTALHKAMLLGHNHIAKILVKKDIGVVDGLTPLHRAVIEEDMATLRNILEEGGNIEEKDGKGWTPLHWAVNGGYRFLVTLLLTKGADIHARNNNGSLPFHVAAQQGYTDLAKIFLEKGVSVNVANKYGATGLYLAAAFGRVAMTSSLLDCGADTETNVTDGLTALHKAAKEGHHAIVTLLLDRNADITAKDQWGFTPLHWAAQKGGHQAITKLLLDRGAYITARDQWGYSPLHWAAQKGHASTAALLLDWGAYITSRDQWGYSPLHRAAEKGHQAIAELLLDRGANITARDKWRYTPLHRAVQNGHTATAELLLDRGANVNTKNEKNQTPLDVAVSQGHEEVAALLRAARAPGWRPQAHTNTAPNVTRSAVQAPAAEQSSAQIAQPPPATTTTAPLRSNVKDAPASAQPQVSPNATSKKDEGPINHQGLPNVGNTCYLNAGLQVMARLYPNLLSNNHNHTSTMVRYGRKVLDKLTNQDVRAGVTTAEAEAFRDILIESYNVGKETHGQLHAQQQEDAALVFNFLLGQCEAAEVEFYSTKVHPAGKYATTTNHEPSTGTALPLSLPKTPISMD